MVPAGLPPTVVPAATTTQSLQFHSEEAKEWYEATVRLNQSQPYATPEFSDDLYPGQEVWKDGKSTKCPYPGCKKRNVAGPAPRAEHVHSHHRDDRFDRLYDLFGKTHKLTTCPWDGCSYSILDGRDFARHLGQQHKRNRCSVVGKKGLCRVKTTPADLPRHLELYHGLLAAADDSNEILCYCHLCYHWIGGRQSISEHYDNHLPGVLENVARRPHLLGVTGVLHSGHICPKCLSDPSLPPEKRLLHHKVLAFHINDHIVDVPRQEKIGCWYPGCTARSKFKPLQLADHFYCAHSIDLMSMKKKDESGQSLSPRTHLISDDSSGSRLRLSAITRAKFNNRQSDFFRDKSTAELEESPESEGD